MSFTGGEGVPGRGKSTDKASAEVGKQEVRSQFDSGLGYGVQMAEAGAARAPWGLLGVGGGGRRVQPVCPGWGGGCSSAGRCGGRPAPTAPLSRDWQFGKCSVCSGNGRIGLQGRLKQLNWAWGWGEVFEKGTAQGQQLDGRERLPGARGGGWDPTSGRKPS